MKTRRDTLIGLLPEDSVLISSPENIRYYSGFTGEGYLAKTASKPWTILTDGRYTTQAGRECPDLPLGKSSELEEFFSDADSTAIEGTLSVAEYEKLNGGVIETEIIDSLRRVKTDDELEKIRRAEEIGDAAFSYIIALLEPGITERTIATELEFFLKSNGAESLSFDTIAASGPNSSMPHAVPGNRKLESGDFLTLDFGCKYEGYCSDMTRTVVIGRATDEMKEVYDIVLDANMKAIDEIKPGMKCSDADAIAREYIKSKGYGEYFNHSLGHSLGLAIHEKPMLSPRDNSILEENMVVTVEPGIYIPDKFGVRIEDLVVITKTGVEVISKSDKTLMEI